MGLLKEEEQMGSPGEGVVMVGVKLDPLSRELLTWALVKVAQPGDTVVALHVLGDNEVVDREEKSSLLSLVKAFDSVISVYEGFCNLKQVDLKLKVCRGSSIRKILVREAKAYAAKNLILGAASDYRKIWRSTSVAKHCAKKLPKECSVLAVDNGKVLFQREGCPTKPREFQGAEKHHRNAYLDVIHRSMSLSKNSKILNEPANGVSKKNQNNEQNLAKVLMKVHPNNVESVMKHSCSICTPTTKSLHLPEPTIEDSLAIDGDEEKALALVPVPKVEEHVSSSSLVIKELPELKPGWPLLRRPTLPEQHDRSARRQISVVQWAMKLPGRQLSLSYVNSDQQQNGPYSHCEGHAKLDGQSGAIVLVGENTLTSPSSPENGSTVLPEELQGLHEKYSATCRLFTYQELRLATSNFLAENLIGKGGSSEVYKGYLPDEKEIAVKILKPSEDALKEFVLEIEIITTLNHKNIVSLLGFCFEEKVLLLVYDFLSRGSLEENLHGDKKLRVAFGWNARYKVAVGVAEALDYLHNGCSQTVIHRDIKSSNILLSDDFEPQLSDFGLAKWASTSSSHTICTDVAGTFGYLAPEYFMHGKVNEKIDVYAFGVVLLELLSGRKPISNNSPKGQESLVMWAKPILNGGNVSQLLDPNLGCKYDPDQMEKMVLAATLCTKRSPRARPRMGLVSKLLRGDKETTKWARTQVNATEESDMLDDDISPRSNLQSHLNLVLCDVEDDSLSTSSIEQSVSLEDYLQGRWSRSSSFD